MAIKKIIVSAFAVAALSSAAFAQTPAPNPPPKGEIKPGAEKMERGPRSEMRRGRPGMMRGGMGMQRGGMNFERLNLTDAQKQRIQAIQASAKSSREANKSQFEELGNLMRLKREGLLTSEQGTRLNALQVQVQTQMRTNEEKTQADILAVLTPDQKTLLEQTRNSRPFGGRGAGREMPRPGQPPIPNRGGTPPTDN